MWLTTFLTKVRNAIVIVFLYFHNGTCQDSGHLSYACPKNMLGEREPPKKKEKKKKKKAQQPEQTYVICDIYICATEYITVHLHFYFFFIFFTFSEEEEEEESEEEGEDPALDSLSQAIAFQVRVQRQEIST